MIQQLFEKHQKLIRNLNTKFKRDFIKQISWTDRLIGIKGARGVGKTTLLLQYIKETYKKSTSCLYVSMDDLHFPFADLISLADAFEKVGGKILFIDEIHKQKDWIVQLKNIYDFHPTLKVVFTGSSILELDHSTADLSRRAIVYTLPGLSFREFLQIELKTQLPEFSLQEITNNHLEITADLLEQFKPFAFWEEYLKIGYYPYYLENKETYSIKLSQLTNQIIEFDLGYLTNIDKAHYFKIKRFLQVLSSQVPFEPNVSNLATEMEMSRASVINYIYYLQKADLIQTLFFDNKKFKTLQKPEKILLHHPNYYYALSSLNIPKGSIREVFFVNQLSYKHEINLVKQGDFIIDNQLVFEIGGKNKTYHQIANQPHTFIAADDIETGFGNKIPLWLFGFLY